MKTAIYALQITFLFLITFSCGSDEEPRVLDSIVISSSNGDRLDVFAEETTVLSVSGLDQFNDPVALPSTILWTVNNENISIDESGNVTALAVGTSIIIAQVDEVASVFEISVWDSSAPRTEIYVSDVGANRNGPHQIIKYDISGDRPTVFINSGITRPQDIVFLEDRGEVLISSLSTNSIVRYDIETGQSLGNFASGLAGPTRIDIGPDNLLYALPWNGGFVKRYELDGTFVDDFTGVNINNSIGMAWDAQGNFYVSSWNNGSSGFVHRFDSNGNDLGIFIDSFITGPTDIWFDSSGNLFVNDWSANNIKKFNSSGSFIEIFISNVVQPEGVAILDDGSLLIGSGGSGSIKKYGRNGNFISDVVESGSGGLVTPNAVIVRKVNQ